MSTRKLYFGTRGYMQYVKMPAINMDIGKAGYSSQSNYLNGGAGVRRSRGSHKEYVISWNLAAMDDLRPVIDYADGLYDIAQGTNLVHFVDPGSEKQNVLSQINASPAQAIADGLVLFSGQAGTLVTTPVNSLLYPARSAKFTLNAASKTTWIPIPADYTLWVGIHGTDSGGGSMVATPTSGLVDLTPVNLTMLAVTDTTRVNQSFDSTACDGVTLSYKNNGALATDTVTVSGVIAQLLPTGETPAAGGFISGQGHSGLQFSERPSLSEYSAGLEKYGMAAKLVEVGSWL